MVEIADGMLFRTVREAKLVHACSVATVREAKLVYECSVATLYVAVSSALER